MIYNKEKRIKYLGFNDIWFSVVGIFILSIVTSYLFSSTTSDISLLEVALSWVIALMFSAIDWVINRGMMIYLRRKYPEFTDDAKRIVLFFLTITFTVVFVDYIGGKLLSLIPGINYNVNVSRLKMLLPIILITIMTMAIYEAIYYNIRLQKSIRQEERSKQAIVQAQLDVLRNQAQPHFFFNTLNTLRDIIDQNPREDAKKFVDKLSDMYRFILETGNENLLPLRDELKFARAYIHIQSERFGTNLMVNWHIPETSLDYRVVPMSLQLLLENAIKHNIISKAKPLAIAVVVNDDKLIVENKIQPKSTQLPSTKLGLANIQKRYALISDTSIEIHNDGNRFRVSLPLIKVSELKTSHENIDY